jgi:hypothetical protein
MSIATNTCAISAHCSDDAFNWDVVASWASLTGYVHSHRRASYTAITGLPPWVFKAS